MASKRLLVGAVTPGRPVRHREASSSWDDVECGTRHRRSKSGRRRSIMSFANPIIFPDEAGIVSSARGGDLFAICALVFEETRVHRVVLLCMCELHDIWVFIGWEFSWWW